MTNPYYNPTGAPAQGSAVTSAVVRTEFAAIQAGFDKMPVLAGNAYEILRVKGDESGFEASGLTIDVSGRLTAPAGLTVSGGTTVTRGITDNATAKALTLSGSGANSVTIANSATNPSINTSAGQLFLGGAGTDVVAISGGSQLVQLLSAGAGITTQLALNKTGTALSGAYPRMLDLNHAAFAGGNAFGIAWRSSSRYDWIGQEATSGHFSVVLNISGTPFTAFASDSASVYLGGASTAPALKVNGYTAGNWVTISSGTSPTIGTSAGSLAISAALVLSQTTLLSTSVALTNGAGASAGTLTNTPAAGNPTKWIPISDNGTTRYIPAW